MILKLSGSSWDELVSCCHKRLRVTRRDGIQLLSSAELALRKKPPDSTGPSSNDGPHFNKKKMKDRDISGESME